GQANNITNVKGNGIACSKFGNNSGSGTNASKCIIAFNVINANNIANSAGINTGADNGTVNTDAPTLYLDIHNNTVSNTTGNGIRQNHTPPVTTFNINGLSPNPASDGGQMEGYVNGLNPGSASGTFGVGGTTSISGGATYHNASCVIP